MKLSECIYKYVITKSAEVDQGRLAKGTLTHIKCDLAKVSRALGHLETSEIDFAVVQDFSNSMTSLSGKSISNLLVNFKTMMAWAKKRKIINDVPEFPTIRYELGWRKTIDRATQLKILAHIEARASERTAMAFRWLMTYTALRPGELPQITLDDISSDGILTIKKHKVSRSSSIPKEIPLLTEDFLKVKVIDDGSGGHIFKHGKKPGCAPNHPFGEKYLRDVWKRACQACGVKGVDLYGGVRHSTQQFYRQHMSFEDCLRLSQHTTSKAGERYLKINHDELRRGYRLSRER